MMNNRTSYAGVLLRSQTGGKPDRNRNASNRRFDTIVGDSHGVIFEDPRKNKDRRVEHVPEEVPLSGCRRKSERRSDRINLGSWWMKRNYSRDNTSR